MRAELIRIERSVFAWLGASGRLDVAELDDDGRPGPTRTLLSGAARPGAFAGRLHAIVGRERLTLDASGSIVARAPVLGPDIDELLAWLAAEAAIVVSEGQTCVRRLDVDLSIPLTPAFFGLAHPPLLRAIEGRIVWAQSAVHLGVINLVRGSRPQPLGGVERLGWRSPGPALALWIDAEQRQAALLGDDGRLERFDLDTGRSLSVAWLPTGTCAASPDLARFVAVEHRTAREATSRPTREAVRSDGWAPGPAALWVDADALLILDRYQLVRVEVPGRW
ncbi:MAG TPA: hypothetical protein VK034_32455 [Enhygromyxa sp.]|nr:hypothetical protein [Enhygromyxa sp.]